MSEYVISLTPREGEVMERLVRGLTYSQIAKELGVSDTRARVCAHHVAKKMGVQTILRAGVLYARMYMTDVCAAKA